MRYDREDLEHLERLLRKVVADGREAENDPREQALSDGVMSISQVAEFCNVSTRLVYKLMERGLPWVKIGRHRKVPRRSLIKYLAEHLVGEP